ncbi:MAG: OmpA family protein [Desulfobacteraceae bacterium]|nr:OmpA family protein [Desulfobacteraceae bacterium]
MTSKAPDIQMLENLKDLLLKTEQNQIQSIEKRLDDPMVRAIEISDALPDAISLSIRQGDKLPRVIQPVIDDSIKVSVQNNPKAIADAIFPALGPAIRKAITSTIMGMIQSLNQVLNHSFSFNGLKWRFEALKTGKSFAEVVLLNTLVFQVEQIVLIHKKTGLVLEHVVTKDAIIQDPDLVSGMLSAIQDFVNDSFTTSTDEDLETLRIGSDRTVWIEKGEHAILATVLRGTPPLELRVQYQELIEHIHLKSGAALEQFDGDSSPFAIFRESLKDGLKSKVKIEQKKISPLLWVFLLFILFTSSYFGFTLYQKHKIWKGYLSRISSEKGLIVLSAKKENKTYHISGLLDPLANNPETLLTDVEKSNLNLKFALTPYHSLDPKFIIQRAKNRLKPPSTITLSFTAGTIHAIGKANQKWIKKFKDQSIMLPGIDSYNIKKIQNPNQTHLESILKDLRNIRIYFKNNRSSLVPDQEDVLLDVLEKIKKIQILQSDTSSPVQIVIFGHTDSSGSERLNLKLSRDRAENIFNYLLVNGINPTFITISGIGTQLPLTKEETLDDKKFNRAISFKTFYYHTTTGGSQ